MERDERLRPEQREAIYAEGGDVLVSASAGSGKTFVMIKRLIRLIVEGKAEVDEILAATFTEAAAADMKQKLKKAVSEEIERGNTALAAQANKISVADICTIHAFCGRLIRTYFFAAGVSPDFKIADESEAALLKNESVDETFAEFYAAGDGDFLKIVDRYRSHRKDETLKTVVKNIYEYCNSELDPERLLKSYEKNFTESGAKAFEDEFDKRLKAAAETVICELLRIKKGCEAAGFTAGAENCDAYLKVLSSVAQGGAIAAKICAESGLPDITRKKAPDGCENLKDGIKKQKARLKALCGFAADTAIDREMISGLYSHSRALTGVVSRYAEIYARKKRENNILDFNDLERFALAALKDGEVLAAVRKKYKYVFVDEYQDVNGVQEEIISLIAGGNLFMVGDAKQSIYGFRGCRAEIFERKEKTVNSGGGKAIGLNCNFRSAQKVIDFVNEIFDFCYVPQYTGLDYRATSRLKSGGIYPEYAEGRAELHHLIKQKSAKAEKPSPQIYDVLKEAFKEEEKEATNLSNLLAEIIDEELTKNYYDVKSGKMKPVTLKDIAVLTRAGESEYVRGIVEGLNGRGIRVISGVSQNVCDFPEIKTLIYALQLTDNFRSDAPLAGTLLSPVGAFSEEDLAEVADFAQANAKVTGFYAAFSDYIDNAKTPLRERLADFKAYIGNLRFFAAFKGAKGVLDKIISDSGYENFLLAENDGEVKIRRLYKFLSETVSGGRLYTVAEFLKRTESVREAFEFSDGGEDDAIRVGTVHSSKGLEFPVVILCGLEKPFNRSDERKTVISDRDRGFFPYFYDDESRTFSDNGYRAVLKAVQREAQIKEEMRLFYVAATRAAYSLHMVFEKQTDPRTDTFSEVFTDSTSFLDFIPASIPATLRSPEKFGLDSLRAKKREVLIIRPDADSAAKMKKDLAFAYPYTADTVMPLKNSVTSLVARGREEDTPVRALFSGGEPFDTETGIIAHKIMENCEFGKDFYGQIEKMKAAGILSDEQLSKVDLEKLKLAAESDVILRLAGKTLFKEREFIVNVPAKTALGTDSDEEVLVQGIIDLLAVEGDTAEIVDYKYSSHGGEQLKKTYSKQLNLYAYAVERALGLKVTGKTIVNVFTGETVKVD